MTQKKKILNKILSGASDSSIQFNNLCSLLDALGFSKRIKGGHYIFYKDGVEEIINVPPYELVIYWSEEDKAFIVEVPELPGCMADGKTYESAVKNVQTVITEWIETAKKLGREIPEPRGRLIYA